MATNNYNVETTENILAGKNVILEVYDAAGENLLAVGGQQGLTINRSADSIEVTAKGAAGGWKSKIAGMKEWSIEMEGLYVTNADGHATLRAAFEKGDTVSIKITNKATEKAMLGGLALVSDYSMEAPYDEAATYSISLEGSGALVDLSDEAVA